MSQNRLLIDLKALYHNLTTISGWMDRQGASWTVVTKVLCGHADTLAALDLLGVRSMGESRLENLRELRRVVPDVETWYLRVPNPSSARDVVAMSNVSLNSELEVIRQLNDEAARLDRQHGVIIMIELGDLREGILPGNLVHFYEHIFELPHIEVMGIGSNLGCLAGSVPSVDQFMQLVLYRELLELKFKRTLPLISGGASSSLPLVLDGFMPKPINHFRIGEALFLGTDLINGGTLPRVKNDAFILEAEIVEIKEKSLVPMVETGASTPFVSDESATADLAPGQRGYRALVNIGHLDTDVTGLEPVDPHHQIAGASSDLTVVNVGDRPGDLSVGGVIRFRLNYAALVRLMGGKYVHKAIVPGLDDFRRWLKGEPLTEVEPALVGLDEGPRISATSP